MSNFSPLVGAIDMALEHVRQPPPHDAERMAAALTEARDMAIEATRELDRLTVRYIAQLRLYERLEIADICDAIADILVNFVGSEDFVIFLNDNDGDLYPVRGMGPADEAAVGVDAAHPLAQHSRGSSTVYDEPGWLALAPLHDAGGAPRGLIAIQGVLAHKPSFTPEDRDMLEELRVHAGRAVGWMFARSQPRP